MYRIFIHSNVNTVGGFVEMTRGDMVAFLDDYTGRFDSLERLVAAPGASYQSSWVPIKLSELYVPIR